MNYEEKVCEIILKTKLIDEDCLKFVQQIKEEEKGDFAFPCFVFAKERKINPNELAKQIAQNVDLNNSQFCKCEAVGGYVNFFLDKQKFCKEVFGESKQKGNEFYTKNVGKNKVIAIDYSSVNLAKHFHIGHLRNTITGNTIASLLGAVGYDIKKLNYLGDFGTPFGEILAMAKRNDVDLSKANVSLLQSLYASSKALSAEDEDFKKEGRKFFKLICDGDKETLKNYNLIKKITLDETQTIFDEFNIKFDSFNGEFFYSKFVDKEITRLKELNLLTTSEGAQIVNLEEYGLGVAVVVSSEGYSLYITRDIAAAVEREKEYGFEKLLYVTATEQILNFKQLFKILELMGEQVATKVKHIAHGRYSLESGKLSSRDGAKALLKDIIAEAKTRALAVVEEKGRDVENKEELASKIGKAALIFTALNYTVGKEVVFNLDRALSFEGETGPYLQYTYARICSIFEKSNDVKPEYSYTQITDGEFKIAKLLYNYKSILVNSATTYEPSLFTKLLLDIAQAFNKFYNETRIITENKMETASKLATCESVKNALKFGLELLGIPVVEKM